MNENKIFGGHGKKLKSGVENNSKTYQIDQKIKILSKRTYVVENGRGDTGHVDRFADIVTALTGPHEDVISKMANDVMSTPILVCTTI